MIPFRAFREMRCIAIVIKLRTYQRHSRGNGNPWVARLSRWIPACAGMTDKCPMEHGYGYDGRSSLMLLGTLETEKLHGCEAA